MIIWKERNTSKTNLSSKNLTIGNTKAKRGSTMKSPYWGKDSCSQSMELTISRKPIFKNLSQTLQFYLMIMVQKEKMKILEFCTHSCVIIILSKEACCSASLLADYNKKIEFSGRWKLRHKLLTWRKRVLGLLRHAASPTDTYPLRYNTYRFMILFYLDTL